MPKGFANHYIREQILELPIVQLWFFCSFFIWIIKTPWVHILSILKSIFKKTILFLWVLSIFFSSILSWLLLLIALTKQNSLNISQYSKKYESAKYAYEPIFFCLPCLLCRIYRFVDKNLQWMRNDDYGWQAWEKW